jgi:hypothetical protein
MRNYYQDFKNLYDSIKPIRGRAEDVRPIGQRRRTWERIEMDGDVVACRLYDTQVVRYYPDGRIGVRCGGWQSPLTAEFIHTHSPWQCFKRNNKLWVMVPMETEKYMHYPIPSSGELQFQLVGNYWSPVGDVLIEKRVVNREKAKQARAPYKPFLNWAKTFLKMSDGWIMHETRKQVIPVGEMQYHYSHLHKEALMKLMLDESSYLKAMCYVLSRRGDANESKLAETITETYDGIHGTRSFNTHHYDMKFDFKLLSGRVYRMVDAVCDVHDKVQVEATTRTQSGIV